MLVCVSLNAFSTPAGQREPAPLASRITGEAFDLSWKGDPVTGTIPDATLAVLLERVGVELDALALIVTGMQAGLSPLLSAASMVDPGVCHHAQTLDLTCQMLGSLSQVLLRASREDASRQYLDLDAIAANLPLASLAARLQSGGRIDGWSGNDLDLF